MLSSDSENGQTNNGNVHLHKRGKSHVDQTAIFLRPSGDARDFFLTNSELCSKKEIFQLIAQFLDESGFQ